jgi:hypothetical protein
MTKLAIAVIFNVLACREMWHCGPHIKKSPCIRTILYKEFFSANRHGPQTADDEPSEMMMNPTHSDMALVAEPVPPSVDSTFAMSSSQQVLEEMKGTIGNDH